MKKEVKMKIDSEQKSKYNISYIPYNTSKCERKELQKIFDSTAINYV